MRDITVCKKCPFYFEYRTEFSKEKDSQLIERIRCYCEIDDTGMDITPTGFSFTNDEDNPKEYEELEIPPNCTYKLEHLVVLNPPENKK